MFQAFSQKRWRKAAVAVLAVATIGSGGLVAATSGQSAEAAGCRNVGAASIKAAQAKLSASGFWIDSADGYYGALTRQAIYAFQKYKNLPRTGCADAATVKHIAQFQGRPALPAQGAKTGATIDQTRQLLYIASAGKVRFVFNTSTGNQIPWREGKYSGKAITPNGHFRVNFERDYLHASSLGLGNMHRPRYFAPGGIAVHGSGFIPPYADSHGCARVSNAAMDFIWKHNLLPMGGNVYVFGKPAAR